MDKIIPNEIATQVSLATSLLKKLVPQLQAIHLYGSAVDGGLKPYSDIDIFVTLASPLDEGLRHTICLELLKISAFPGTNKSLRALEVTFVFTSEVIPWRHPAKRELQFGEWLRSDILNGSFEPPVIDPDLAILLTKIRKNSIALFGPEADQFFEPVPKKDFFATLRQTLSLWNQPEDWKGDERNILLTLARIWYSAETGEITSKESATNWLLERLPAEYQDILRNALEEHLGATPNNAAYSSEKIGSFISYSKMQIENSLNRHRF